MTTAVIGVGALGSLFAARLSRIVPVVMIGQWAAHLEQIERHGLQLIELDGQRHFVPIQTTTSWTAAAAMRPERLLILVKSGQTAAKADAIGRYLEHTTSILTLQNGLGNIEPLQLARPNAHVTAGTTAQGATVVEPGVVRHAGNGQTALPLAAADWGALLQAAGLPVSLVADVDGIVWGKLVINAAINPLTALLGQPNGFLAEDPAARATMSQAAVEAAAVAAALGISLPYSDPAAAALAVAQQTAANHSSMLQDVTRGVETEIEAITGQIVRLGEQHGIPTPVNKSLYDKIKRLTAHS